MAKEMSDKILTINEEMNYDNEFLIRLSSLTKGQLLDRRMDIRKTILLASINSYDIDSSFDIIDVISKIKVKVKCNFSKQDLIPILDSLCDDGIIEALGNFRFKLIKKVDLPDYRELIQPVWDEFFSFFLKKQYSQYDPHLHKNARDVFEKIILKIVSRFSVSKPLENQIETIPIEDIQSVISSEIKSKYFPDHFDNIYSKIIISYLTSTENTQNLLAFIFDCYSGLININLVEREQEFSQLDEKDFCDEIKYLLLDTNFIISLICETDPKHTLTFAILKHSQKCCIPVYYTDKTRDEMQGVILIVKKEGKNIVQKGRSPADNQFILDYLRKNNEHGTSWIEYNIYLDNWEKQIKRSWNINEMPSQLSSNYNKKTFEIVKNALPTIDDIYDGERAKKTEKFEPKKRGVQSYYHDAYCIAIIHQAKQYELKKAKKIPVGPLFLSFDNRLSTVISNFLEQEDEEIGYVIQPRILLNYFLAFNSINFNEEDKDEFAVALLKYTARVEHSHLSLKEYSRLVSIRTGIGEENSEILKEILLKSPLIEEIQKALHGKHEEEADILVNDFFLIPNIREMITEIALSKEEKREYSDTIDRLRRKMSEMRDENYKNTAIIEELRKNPQTITYVYHNETNYINFESTVDPSLQKQIAALIQILEANGVFEENIIEKPPSEGNLEKIFRWLDGVQSILEKGNGIREEIKNLLPLITWYILLIKGFIP